jgi:prevent-host-death family protein
MTSIGSFEAKTHLPQLLARVGKGERFVITKRGRPVAMLVPLVEQGTADVRELVKNMLDWRDSNGPRLEGKCTLRQLIDEGRRF